MIKNKSFKLLLGILFSVNSLSSQVFTGNEWYKAVKNISSDSVAAIERLAAFKFNTKINKYREDNGIVPMQWNEVLWLTARNHSVWMRRYNKLSHTENLNTIFFTGKLPSERIEYVANDKNNYNYTGENALYNYSATGNSVNEIAENIAKESFNDWKSSPGHNENMLTNNYNMHGVAFILEENRVWATNIFTHSKLCYTQNESGKKLVAVGDISLAVEKTDFEKSVSKTHTGKYVGSTSVVKKEIGNKLHLFFLMNQSVKTNKKFSMLAKSFADKLIQSKKQSKEESKIYVNSEKIKLTLSYNENSFMKLFLKRRQVQKTEILIEKEKENFQSEEICKQITDILEKKNKDLSLNNIGLYVNVKRNKNTYLVAFVCISS